MTTEYHSFLSSCLALMLRPIADFCIARGLRFQTFLEVSKDAFVRAAERRLDLEHKDLSTSRVSMMTGLQRPEVNRLLKIGPSQDARDYIARVVGQWVADKRFTSRKKPRPLGFQGTGSEFALLVKAVSKELNPHTVRFELERLKLIEVDGGEVILRQSAFLSTGDPEQTLRFGAEDVSDLLAAVEENAFSKSALPNLHARTQYDNIPDSYVERIKTWTLELGRRIHDECRAALSQYDRDINTGISKSEGRNRVILGTFSRIEPLNVDHRERKD